jgi:hypothetical protein
MAGNVTENIIQIHRPNKVFHLAEPIDLTVKQGKSGQVLIGYPPLGLRGLGVSRLEALESFVDQFAEMWESIAIATDTDLTPATRKLKRVMLSLVDHVTSNVPYDDEEAFMDDEDYRIGEEREREGKFLTLEQFHEWHEKRRRRRR